MRDSLVRVREVESVLLDIVQARVHVDASVRLVRVHVEYLERGPRAVPLGQVGATLIQREPEYATLPSEYVHLHGVLQLGHSQKENAALHFVN